MNRREKIMAAGLIMFFTATAFFDCAGTIRNIAYIIAVAGIAITGATTVKGRTDKLRAQ